jgi:hypothetical protein
MNQLFIHSVDVKRMVNTPDDEMGSTKSYADVFTGVKCWIAKHEGIETIEEFGGSENFAYEMTTKQSGILVADVIVWGSKRFTVKRMQTANTPRGVHHYVLRLEELK